MNLAKSPLERFLDQALALLADHAQILRGVSAAMNAHRSEFDSKWRAVLDQDSTYAALDRWRGSGEARASAFHILLDGLVSEDPTLRAYLRAVGVWSAEAFSGGASYSDQTRLWETFRRTLLPFLLREYDAGPELQIVFAALDALERAVLGVIAVSGIELAQQQLRHGTHQRSVGRLTGGVTHALNNTLAIIVGRAQILEEQLSDEVLREELRAIQRAARGGADSLRRLQQFAANGEGHEPARLDVNTIVDQVVQLMRFRWGDDAEASGITIHVLKDLAPVPPVIGQAARLRDALVELILNSVEAMPLGGTVTVRTERGEDTLRILVADQGEGMDVATQARATEPFFTTKGTSHVGLGLAMVANAVREMGGSFALTSAAGEGTTAVISLPVAEEIKQAADLPSARLARWAGILIVDDEPMVRDVGVRTFQLRGFRTAAAESGVDALRVLSEQGPFEVVMLDLGMPGMNGFETARAIKDLYPRTVIILMTGWAAELDAQKLRDAGVDRAITKPFDTQQVIRFIGEALAIQQSMH